MRTQSIARQLKVAQSFLRIGNIEAAMRVIQETNGMLDLLRIEAQHTTLNDSSGMEHTIDIAAAQTNTKYRSMSGTSLSGQFRLLLDTDTQEFTEALKRQVGFTVRTQYVLHRRVPLSDEESNIMIDFANSIQRLPSSNVQSLFCFTGRLNGDA
jgi:hypothetical protein